MSTRLASSKFNICANPNGILFNPLSIAQSLDRYLNRNLLSSGELHFVNELWNSWDFHTRFSHVDRNVALTAMNQSIEQASDFLHDADWLIVTLGSAFQYYLHSNDAGHRPVANCHRAPASYFERRLLTIEEIADAMDAVLQQLERAVPKLRVLFTVSPVRHVREGLVENNRSKARLIEVVHYFTETKPNCSYFPAYEIVIDALRDYRFYDLDLVHPNFQATEVVWQQFCEAFADEESNGLITELKEIDRALRHRPRFPETQAHANFKAIYLSKITALRERFPTLDFEAELAYFSA